MKTTGGIEDHNVKVLILCMFNRCFGDVYRVLFISHRENFHTLFFTVDLQLCDCCRTINITGYKQWLSAFCFQLSGDLCCGCCLTCTLKTCHHNNSNLSCRAQRDLRGLTSHQRYQFIVYDLDHHLPRIQSVHHILTDRTFLYRFDKLFYHFKTDICFQKCHLNFF